MAIRTFQYRLYPTEAQKQALQMQLDVSRHVYNMALEERKRAWELEEQSLGKRELPKRQVSCGHCAAKQPASAGLAVWQPDVSTSGGRIE